MKRIIVTPAGRKRYMALLAEHLAKQRSSFDEWHIWQNTENIEDIQFFNTLDAKIIIPPNSNPSIGSYNIGNFYLIDSTDSNSLYLRLDDDIVWMESNFINKMFEYREKNKENFLIFANTINNSICSHLQMRFGSIPWSDLLGYSCFDAVSWGSPIFAEKIHNLFISNINQYNKYYFSDWNLYMSERVSVNAISWRGSDFSLFHGDVTTPTTKNAPDEEDWLTKYGPTISGNKRSVIYGQCLCSHYSYFTQREYLDKTNILSRYVDLLNSSV
jgi:hypothetical protein